MTTYDCYNGPPFPRRGDLMQSNVGDRRERTWMILRSRRLRSHPKGVARFELWMARWWELEPDMRMRLYESAERHGGQNLFTLYRYKATHKPTFEQHMKRFL